MWFCGFSGFVFFFWGCCFLFLLWVVWLLVCLLVVVFFFFCRLFVRVFACLLGVGFVGVFCVYVFVGDCFVVLCCCVWCGGFGVFIVGVLCMRLFCFFGLVLWFRGIRGCWVVVVFCVLCCEVFWVVLSGWLLLCGCFLEWVVVWIVEGVGVVWLAVLAGFCWCGVLSYFVVL